ncbi:MAG: zinc metallopeptidase [Chloroflexia bacterium]|nr:zinc metallopeptidase [Chloroflexia bacterium]
MFTAMVAGDNYLIWMIPGVLLTIFAQIRLKLKFRKYSKLENAAHITGKETARRILNSENLQKVPIKSIRGNLTDHYDPRSKTVNLSRPIYNKTSLGAMGVAAHETGHAIQDKDGYFWMNLRGWIVPFASIGTNFGYTLIIAGLIIGWQNGARIGVLLFFLTTVFALVTLPVEFNASKRAKKKLHDLGLTEGEEDRDIDDVLDAAAFTYVASFATSAIQGFYWWLTVRKEFHEEEDTAELERPLLPEVASRSAASRVASMGPFTEPGDEKISGRAEAAPAGTAGKVLTENRRNEEKDNSNETALGGAVVGAVGKAFTSDTNASSESSNESRRSRTDEDNGAETKDRDVKKRFNPVKTAKTAGKVVKTASKLTDS